MEPRLNPRDGNKHFSGTCTPQPRCRPPRTVLSLSGPLSLIKPRARCLDPHVQPAAPPRFLFHLPTTYLKRWRPSAQPPDVPPPWGGVGVTGVTPGDRLQMRGSGLKARHGNTLPLRAPAERKLHAGKEQPSAAGPPHSLGHWASVMSPGPPRPPRLPAPAPRASEDGS